MIIVGLLQEMIIAKCMLIRDGIRGIIRTFQNSLRGDTVCIAILSSQPITRRYAAVVASVCTNLQYHSLFFFHSHIVFR